jgi:[acyl-carrier-protein] S-malonyltransferase
MALADEVLGFPLSQICYAGPEEVLTDTINAQPALMAASIAALAALQERLGSLPRPLFFAGHSMGEYTALVAANSISFADGLRLVRERGRLMAQAGQEAPGKMAAVLGLDEAQVAALCAQAAAESGGLAQIANDNCPGQIVISGDEAGMEQAMRALQAAGAKRVLPLQVSIAAHSPLMQPAADALSRAIRQTHTQPPVAPLIANTSAQPLTEPESIMAELEAQLTGSVRWTESMQLALAQGATHFAEFGPGEVLTGLLKRIDRKASRISVGDPAGVAGFVLA